MALHLTPEQHDADPPSGWTVHKADKHGKRWDLRSKSGGTLDTFETKAKAEAARFSGRVFELYQREGRWFAGETQPGWKPYAECKPRMDAAAKQWVEQEAAEAIAKRLKYLRAELRAECISYEELHELQSLAAHIEPGDVELLEAAGVPEFHDPV